jgi:Fe-S cluster biosynthesis and repair protein YggX
MPRTILCKKYHIELDALDAAPLPGKKGQEILETISAKAWQEWVALQTMLINEKQLNMMDIGARHYLIEQRDKFFNNQPCDHVEGYVPPHER